MRATCLSLCLLMAGSLSAFDTAPLSGSVAPDRRRAFLYEIDFGPSVVSWTLTCNLVTNSSAGLIVRLIDLDTLASSGSVTPAGVSQSILSGSGATNVSLNGTHNGIREFVLEIETAGAIGSSDFSGTLTTSDGEIIFLTDDQLNPNAPGLKIQVERLAHWDRFISGGATLPASLELDFGPNPRTIFLRFEAVGSNVSKVELLDVTGGSATFLATFFNPAAGNAATVALTHSGKAFLRVNTTGQPGQTATASWSVSVPSGIVVGRVGADTKEPTKNCSTGEAGGVSPILLLGALAALALAARLGRDRGQRPELSQRWHRGQ